MIDDKFKLKTHTFPDVVASKGRLPAGSDVVMILAKDKAKRDASWEVVRTSGPVRRVRRSWPKPPATYPPTRSPTKSI